MPNRRLEAEREKILVTSLPYTESRSRRLLSMVHGLLAELQSRILYSLIRGHERRLSSAPEVDALYARSANPLPRKEPSARWVRKLSVETRARLQDEGALFLFWAMVRQGRLEHLPPEELEDMAENYLKLFTQRHTRR